MSKWIKDIDRTKEIKNQMRELEKNISREVAKKLAEIIEEVFNIKPQVLDCSVIVPLEKTNVCFICHTRNIRWFVCGTTVNQCYIASSICTSTMLHLESLINKIKKIVSRSIQFDKEL